MKRIVFEKLSFFCCCKLFLEFLIQFLKKIGIFRNDDFGEDFSELQEPRNLLKDFFVDLNDSVLSAFHAATSFRDGKISSEDILSMTLDPSLDIPFLTVLAELRGFQVELPGAVWCPRLVEREFPFFK